MTKKELKYLKTFESFLLEALSEDKEMAKDISQKLIAALSKTLNDDEEEALEQIMRIESKEMLDMVSDEVKKSTKMDLPTYLNDEMSDVDVEYKNIFTWIKELDPEMAKKYKENKFLQKTGKVIDYIQDFTWEGFLADLYSLGSKVLMKLLSIIVKTYQKFKHWREENPKTWKLIVVVILLLIFIFVFAYSAYCKKTGQVPKFNVNLKDALTSAKGSGGPGGPPVKNEGVDAAIGILEKMKDNTFTDTKQISAMNRAMNYLIEMKKGNTISLDSEAKQELSNALGMVKDYYDKAEKVHPNYTSQVTYLDKLKDFAERGADYLKANWEKVEYVTPDGKYAGSEEKWSFVTKSGIKQAFSDAMGKYYEP